MSVRATVLIPTHNHGNLITFAARTALAQSVSNLEVFIVGDGMTEETRAAAAQLQQQDSRVRVFDLPKGPRLGEAYRDGILQQASGRIVCYLSDDDLWFPNHVETMERLLQDADYAHTLSVKIKPNGRIVVGNKVDARIKGLRKLLEVPGLRVGGGILSCMGHTMAMYRRLPDGWSVTPEGTPTDVYMARKFMVNPECRLASGTTPTLVRFPSVGRRKWSAERRSAELEEWSARIADPEWQAAMPMMLFDELVRADAEKFVELKVVDHRRREAVAALRRRILVERERVATFSRRLESVSRREHRLRVRCEELRARLELLRAERDQLRTRLFDRQAGAVGERR